MGKILLISFFILNIHFSFSQIENLNAVFDSIVKQADLLYDYEKVTWNSTDLALANDKVKDNFSNYLIYHKNDSIFSVFTGLRNKMSVAKYTFLKSNLKVPVENVVKTEPLSEFEQNLLVIKSKVLEQLNSNAAKYELNYSEGYNPNLVMIPKDIGYDFYIIIGTPNSNVIPFGNDHYFKVDIDGKITEWQKLHKTLIPAKTEMEGGSKIVSFIHSHLKMTPYITATDICTFRLYGVDLHGYEEFQVLSTALNKLFKYNASTNSISESEY